MDIHDKVKQAIADLGFDTPTPIQAQAIEPLLHGRDVVGVAQTGTGKTAAFGLPMFNFIDTAQTQRKRKDDKSPATPQALILAPTRELALQNAHAIDSFATHLPKMTTACVYGGSSYGPQIKALREGAPIVVGTPGRIMDLMDKGELAFTHVKFFVLDEADEMLRMGFQEDVEKISADIPERAVRALFSATMPRAIEKVAQAYLHDPIRIAVTPQASTVENIRQTYAVVPYKFKTEALTRVLSTTSAAATIVFVATRVDVEDVTHRLAAAGFSVGAISGDVNQAERERMVNRLRQGTMQVLVATDVAARGLDVDRVELVVNYDVPREAEAYVHRIGRTGRAGREGTSLTFFTPKEKGRLKAIEQLTKTELEEITVPSPADVASHKATQALHNALARSEKPGMETYHHAVADILALGQDTLLDVTAGLVALVCRDTGPSKQQGSGRIRYEETVDELGRFIKARFEHGRVKGSRNKRRGVGQEGGSRRKFSRGTLPRYRVDVGYRDGINPGAIVGAITGESNIRGNQVGHIEMMPSFSLVEIEGGLDHKAAKRLAKTRIAGRALKIREDTGPRGGSKKRSYKDRQDDRGYQRKGRRGKDNFRQGKRGRY